jgi:anti-sigma-K factor RskA
MTPLDRLRRFDPPRASSALYQRILAGARDATVVVSRSDRLWFSTGWRFAWVATIAACVVVEALAVRATGPRPQPPVPAVTREADAAAAAIGIKGQGLIGDRAVTNDETVRVWEVPL